MSTQTVAMWVMRGYRAAAFFAVVSLCSGCVEEESTGSGDSVSDQTGSGLENQGISTESDPPGEVETSEGPLDLPLAALSYNNNFFPQPPEARIEVEPLRPLVKDWEVLDAPYPKFKSVTAKAIKIYHDLIQSEKEEMKFSGWEAYLVLHTLNVAYLVYRDTSYLDTFVEFADYFKKYNEKHKFFDGRTPPQWPRLHRYNIFSVSPYIEYDPADEAAIMAERGWETLYWSDINYSGLFLDQFLRFVQIVKANNLSQYDEYANDLIPFSKQVIASHEAEWVRTSESSGYYTFPKNAPWYLDGVEMPVNEAAIFGGALVRLHMLTGEDSWLTRATEMWAHFRKSMAFTESEYITYPYVIGRWQAGWDVDSSPSINTPTSPAMDWFENFHKTALTLSFLQLLNHAGYDTMTYLNEFYRHIVATKYYRNAISLFPSTLGHEWPKDSYHSVLPFGFDGWVGLVVNDSDLRQSALSTLEYYIEKKYWHIYHLLSLVHKWSKLENVSASTLNPPVPTADVFSTKLKFKSEQSDDDECTIEGSSEDGYADIEFQHLTPKSNPLRLFLDSVGVIRLYVKDGTFYGRAYVPKNSCIRLYWKVQDRPTKYPGSEAENLIKVTQYHYPSP